MSVSSGWVLVESNSISTPTTDINIALPPGYNLFQLLLYNFMTSSPSSYGLAAAYSPDGSASFFNGASDYTQYGYSDSISENDSLPLIIFTNFDPAQTTIQVDTVIYPGGPTTPANMQIITNYLNSNSARYSGIRMANICAHNGRQTVIKIMPYGNGDIPPTSGIMITAGSYVLLGSPIG